MGNCNFQPELDSEHLTGKSHNLILNFTVRIKCEC